MEQSRSSSVKKVWGLSSNVNEVIRAGFFFLRKDFVRTKAIKAPKAPKAQRHSQAKAQNATSEQ